MVVALDFRWNFSSLCSHDRYTPHSVGTQRVILDLICNIALHEHGIFSTRNYPEYIADELLVLLGKMVKGQSGSHIDGAMKKLDSAPCRHRHPQFAAEAMEIISRSRACARSS